MPTVSVIIPAYNAEAHIANALQTVWRQDYRPLEVIVVDDGSIDGTYECVKEFSKKHHFLDLSNSDADNLSWSAPKQQFELIYVRQQNAGPSKARNRGIQLCLGEYIAFLDVDDSWREDKLSLQVAMIESGACDFVFTNTIHESINGRKQFMFESQAKVPFKLRGNTLIEPWRDLIHKNFVTTSSVVARRRCFEDGRLFNENRRLVEDWELWLKIADKFNFGYVAELCVIKLAVESGLSNNSLGMTENCIDVMEDYIQSRFNVSFAVQVEDADARSALFNEYKWGGYNALKLGKGKFARRYLSKANSLKFDLKTVIYYLRSFFV